MEHKELELSMKHNDFMTRTDDDPLRLLGSSWGKGNYKVMLT